MPRAVPSGRHTYTGREKTWLRLLGADCACSQPLPSWLRSWRAGPGRPYREDTEVNAEGVVLESLDVTGGAIMLELEGEPAAVTYAKARDRGASKEDAGRESKASKQAADQAQGDVLGSLDSSGIDATPLYQVQTAYNGIAVQAAPGAIDALAALPGVDRGARDPARRAGQPLERAADRLADGVAGVRQHRHRHESIAVIDTGHRLRASRLRRHRLGRRLRRRPQRGRNNPPFTRT